MRHLAVLFTAAALAACSKADVPADTVDAGPKAPFIHAPIAKRERTSVELKGGRRLNDDYAWLRKKGSPEVEAHLRAENAWTEAVMAPTKGLQDTLYTEMVGRVQEDDVSVPMLKRGYVYSTRTVAGKQYAIIQRAKAPDGPVEVMLDVNELAQNEKFMRLRICGVSDDNQQLAYLTDVTGFREYTLYVKDLKSGARAPEQMVKVSSCAWAADSKTLFYTVQDTAHRSYRLYRHVLGAPVKDDALVYEEADEHFDLTLVRTRSDAYVVLYASSATTSEARVLDASTPAGAFRVLLPRKHDVEYQVAHRGGSFYFVINDTGRTFRLVEAPVASPASFKELIPSRPDTMLESVEVFKAFYVVTERSGGLQHLRSVDFATGKQSAFELPEPDYTVGGEDNAELDTPTYRYSFESPVTPPTVFERTIATGETKALKRQPVPTYEASRYETQRLSAPASDGVGIPISIAYKKGTPRDGSASLLLFGYGAYGLSYDAEFDADLVSLLDRGVVVAVAHVRGGGELGKPWHDAGRMMNKKNTFTDFIACAEYLHAQKWSRPDRTAIRGGSAGGLLVGAVLNLRPDLFKAAVADVPFVDVINTMLDRSLPLTVEELEEWGDPTVEGELQYLLGYSPYDNVAVRAYPALLVRSSYNDSQVLYHEPAKWVAKLRATKTDGHPLLLRMELDPAGHGGRSGRYDALRDEAFPLAFILSQLGDAAAPSPGH